MKRWLSIGVLAGLPILVWLTSATEGMSEFDGVNYRLRYIQRHVFFMTEIPFWQQSSEPAEHAVGARLRDMGILPPIDETEARWVFTRGSRTGNFPMVRGWIGDGRNYERGLGRPVTLPAEEKVDENLWVQWAKRRPDDAKAFFQRLTQFAKRDRPGGAALLQAKMYLEDNPNISAAGLVKELQKELADF